MSLSYPHFNYQDPHSAKEHTTNLTHRSHSHSPTLNTYIPTYIQSPLRDRKQSVVSYRVAMAMALRRLSSTINKPFSHATSIYRTVLSLSISLYIFSFILCFCFGIAILCALLQSSSLSAHEKEKSRADVSQFRF